MNKHPLDVISHNWKIDAHSHVKSYNVENAFVAMTTFFKVC